jgi:hypothetical protein
VFSVLGHVDDVAVGGGRVVSTSGFVFPVPGDVNRSTCSGEFFGNAYFRFGGRSKIVWTPICLFSTVLGVLVIWASLKLPNNDFD